jgi:hypothetical protein
MKFFLLLPAWLLLGMPVFSQAAPLTTPNLSPPVIIHGGPAWTTAPQSEQAFSWELTSAVANHFSLHQKNDGLIRLDGETRYLHLGLRRRVKDRWLVGIDVPWIQHTAGGLDSFIEGWHDFFGLPNGGRDTRPQDQLQFRYVNDGDVVFNLTEGTSGLGDASVGVGRILGVSSNWLLWAELKIPTGEIDRLTGSGSTDMSLSLTHRGDAERWGRPLNWYWGASISHLGETELRSADADRMVGSAMAGLTYQLFSRVAFKGQLEAATPHYGGGLGPLADPALSLALGAEVRLGAASVLDLAIVEDLSVNASPDVTFIINFRVGY